MTAPAKPPLPKQWRYLLSDLLVLLAIRILSGNSAAAQSGTFHHSLERLREGRDWVAHEWMRDHPEDWPRRGTGK